MKHIKLFEEFQSLEEGQIQVYPPGNPYKAEGSMTWPGVHTWLPKYKAEGRGIIIGADFDYDKFIADPKYRSIPLGTWKDKNLPTFLEKNPNYDEVEYDFVEIVPNPEKEPREPWVKIADKNGVEFMIPPFMIIDIIKGGSVKLKIFPGETFLVNNMRGKIADFINGKIVVKLQNGTTQEFTPQEWKSRNFTALDERKNARVNESFWTSLFGKPTVQGAAKDHLKSSGFSHIGTDDKENYIMFQGKKFYQDDIEYDDVYSTKPLPRVEGGKLIIANPQWKE